MLVGISSKEISNEYGIHTWKYDLECPESDENDIKAFCGSFWVDIRLDDDDVYFNWGGIEFDESIDNLEAMKLWINDHHDELENAINKGYIVIEVN